MVASHDKSDLQADHYSVHSLAESENDVDSIVIKELLIKDDDSDETKLHAFAASPFRFSASASIYPARLLPSTRLAFVDDDSIDVAASTRSLLEQYLDYHEENGRRYCGEYYMPNDDFEQTRMYLNHQVHLQMLKGAPTTVPLDNPKKIIDIGCGTGEWVCQIGELYPNCDVVGKDISAIQPPNPPHNVFFEIEDVEEPWLQNPDSVDFVHFREMVGAFRDWRFIYEQSFECLKPGGYIEVQETDDDGGAWAYIAAAFPPDSEIHQVGRDLREAGIRSGRPLGIAHMSKELLEEAGFVDIKETYLEIPVNLDSGNEGKIWLVSCIDSIEALGLRLLTRYMNYDPEKCKEQCERIAHDMAAIARDPEKARHMRSRIKIITGRKPETPVVRPTLLQTAGDCHSQALSTAEIFMLNQNLAETGVDDEVATEVGVEDDGSRTRRGSMDVRQTFGQVAKDAPPIPIVSKVTVPISPPSPNPIATPLSILISAPSAVQSMTDAASSMEAPIQHSVVESKATEPPKQKEAYIPRLSPISTLDMTWTQATPAAAVAAIPVTSPVEPASDIPPISPLTSAPITSSHSPPNIGSAMSRVRAHREAFEKMSTKSAAPRAKK